MAGKPAHNPPGSEAGDVTEFEYRDYSFKVTAIFSPYLIRTQRSDPNNVARPFNLFLDELDDTWTARIREFDYLVISAAQWFSRPSYFYLNRTLVGCLYCSDPTAAHLPAFSFGYSRALRTALSALGAAGTATFLQTYAPSHFEGGEWNDGGDCLRRRPYRRNETGVLGKSEVYGIQEEKMGIAGEGTGGRFRLFDVTKAMALRADGHPSKYGRSAGANETFRRDCVHWCLPGPIDAWNDLLQELLRRELEGNADES